MKKFAIRWKLVFVAALTLMLAAASPVPDLWSAEAMFLPSRIYASALQEALQTASQARHQSPSNIVAYRAAQPDDLDQERRLSPGPIIGLICAIVASSVALGVAFGLRRRIDRIAGPDPDKNDDE